MNDIVVVDGASAYGICSIGFGYSRLSTVMNVLVGISALVHINAIPRAELPGNLPATCVMTAFINGLLNILIPLIGGIKHKNLLFLATPRLPIVDKNLEIFALIVISVKYGNKLSYLGLGMSVTGNKTGTELQILKNIESQFRSKNSDINRY